jgi:hypothetical protein
MSICTAATGGLGLRSRHLLVKLAHLVFVSKRNAVAHGGRALTKSLELFADWAAVPSMFAVVTRDSAVLGRIPGARSVKARNSR